MSETEKTTPPPAKPKPVPAPAKLARTGAGRKLWRDVVGSGTYLLRPDELRILEDACFQSDRIEKIRAAAESCGLTARGSAGQLAIHPLIKELRELEQSRAGLLLKLKLPDGVGTESGGEQPRSVSAREAANSRWGKSG